MNGAPEKQFAQIEYRIQKEVAREVTRVIDESGLPQQQVANMLGVNLMSLRRYMSGESAVKVSRIAHLEQVLGLAPGTVLQGTSVLPQKDLSELLASDPTLVPNYRKLLQDTYLNAQALSRRDRAQSSK